jgi:hypothetical protein
MKSYDVYMDSFVNVKLPDDVDPSTNEGYRAMHEAAIMAYRARLQTPAEISFNWERYEEGDTE